MAIGQGTNFFQQPTPASGLNVALTNEFGNAYIAKVSATANLPADGATGVAPGAYISDGTTGLHYTNIGTSSNALIRGVGTVSSKTVASLGTTQNSTPTIAQLMGGIVTQTGQTGSGTVTLPLGATITAAFNSVPVGYTFSCIFANLGGGQTLTITGATGTTVLGTTGVASGKNAELFFNNTGAGTWNVYTNVSA